MQMFRFVILFVVTTRIGVHVLVLKKNSLLILYSAAAIYPCSVCF